jgi:hypothetical protein
MLRESIAAPGISSTALLDAELCSGNHASRIVQALVVNCPNQSAISP